MAAVSNIEVIDREKKCPFLLRVFCSSTEHNNLADFNEGKVPSNELQIYTWTDATLKELASLIQEVRPDSRLRGTVFEFAVVSATTNPRGNRVGYGSGIYHYVMKDIGTIVSGRLSDDDSKKLSKSPFEIGDYIDVAITGSESRFMDRLDRRRERNGRDFRRDDRDFRRDNRRDDRRGGFRRGGSFGGGRADTGERRPRLS